MSRDPWRYRCPRGHTGWQRRTSESKPSKTDYYCNTCQSNGEDPHFEELLDMKYAEAPIL